jgi:hypothetical protein
MADIGTAGGLGGQDATSEESLLLDHVQRIERNRQGSFAVHVHLSKLRSHLRQSHYIRVAARSFDALLNNHEATLYLLSNTDMVLMCRNVRIDEIDVPIYKVRALFSEDPITFGAEGSMENRFTAWFDLAQSGEYAAFLAQARDMAARAQRQKRDKPGERAPGMAGRPLDPTNLSAINKLLQGTRIADLIRQQSAVEVYPGGKGDVLFREHYVSMPELQTRIAPEVNLFASPWLFQYLTETLDRRMLSVIGRRDFAKMKQAISVNLNITTILSPGFQNFHDQINGNSDKIVVEMQTIDVFADMGAFAFARDWLQEHGYRVLIDGLNPLSLQFFDPSVLAADFVKVSWSPDFLGGVPEDRMVEMREVVEDVGSSSVILARVDSEDAVKWALTLGIQRFQGHYIDRVVEAMVAKGII